MFMVARYLLNFCFIFMQFSPPSSSLTACVHLKASSILCHAFLFWLIADLIRNLLDVVDPSSKGFPALHLLSLGNHSVDALLHLSTPRLAKCPTHRLCLICLVFICSVSVSKFRCSLFFILKRNGYPLIF